MNSPIKNTPIEIAKLTAKSTSIRKPGRGNTIISTMPMIAVGIASSARKLCCGPAVVVDVGADATGPRFARNMPAKIGLFPFGIGPLAGDSHSRPLPCAEALTPEHPHPVSALTRQRIGIWVAFPGPSRSNRQVAKGAKMARAVDAALEASPWLGNIDEYQFEQARTKDPVHAPRGSDCCTGEGAQVSIRIIENVSWRLGGSPAPIDSFRPESPHQVGRQDENCTHGSEQRTDLLDQFITHQIERFGHGELLRLQSPEAIVDPLLQRGYAFHLGRGLVEGHYDVECHAI